MTGISLVERPVSMPAAALISWVVDNSGCKGDPDMRTEQRLGHGNDALVGKVEGKRLVHRDQSLCRAHAFDFAAKSL